MNEGSCQVVGIVLAGGLSRRMGGAEKSRMQLAGKSLLEHVLDRVRPQVDVLLLNANGDPQRFAGLQLPVIADVISGFAGPLAGILTGMEWVQENYPRCQWLASFAADTPFLPGDLVARLVSQAQLAETSLACAASNDRVHPVCSLWPVSLAKELRRAMVQNNSRKVGAWAARHDCVQVSWDNQGYDPFFNINRPQDLEEAERILVGDYHQKFSQE